MAITRKTERSINDLHEYSSGVQSIYTHHEHSYKKIYRKKTHAIFPPLPAKNQSFNNFAQRIWLVSFLFLSSLSILFLQDFDITLPLPPKVASIVYKKCRPEVDKDMLQCEIESQISTTTIGYSLVKMNVSFEEGFLCLFHRYRILYREIQQLLLADL